VEEVESAESIVCYNKYVLIIEFYVSGRGHDFLQVGVYVLHNNEEEVVIEIANDVENLGGVEVALHLP
jgi:hypothetical protein